MRRHSRHGHSVHTCNDIVLPSMFGWSRLKLKSEHHTYFPPRSIKEALIEEVALRQASKPGDKAHGVRVF